MKKVVIYSKEVCPYCVRAKTLLKQKNVSYEEIKLDQNPDRVDEMLEKSGGRHTVPQIFIGDYHVGGFDDLWELEKQGKVDELLKD